MTILDERQNPGRDAESERSLAAFESWLRKPTWSRVEAVALLCGHYPAGPILHFVPNGRPTEWTGCRSDRMAAAAAERRDRIIEDLRRVRPTGTDLEELPPRRWLELAKLAGRTPRWLDLALEYPRFRRHLVDERQATPALIGDAREATSVSASEEDIGRAPSFLEQALEKIDAKGFYLRYVGTQSKRWIVNKIQQKFREKYEDQRPDFPSRSTLNRRFATWQAED